MSSEEAIGRQAQARDIGVFGCDEVTEITRMKKDAAAAELRRASWNSSMERQAILPYASPHSHAAFFSNDLLEDEDLGPEWEEHMEASHQAGRAHVPTGTSTPRASGPAKVVLPPASPRALKGVAAELSTSCTLQPPCLTGGAGQAAAGKQLAPQVLCPASPVRLASRAQPLVPSSGLHRATAGAPAPVDSVPQRVAAAAPLLPVFTQSELERLCTDGPRGFTHMAARGLHHSCSRARRASLTVLLPASDASVPFALLSPAPPGPLPPSSALFPSLSTLRGRARRLSLDQPSALYMSWNSLAASQQVQQQQGADGVGPDPPARPAPAEAGTPRLSLQPQPHAPASDGAAGPEGAGAPAGCSGGRRGFQKASSFNHGSHRNLHVSFQEGLISPGLVKGQGPDQASGAEGWLAGSGEAPACSGLAVDRYDSPRSGCILLGAAAPNQPAAMALPAAAAGRVRCGTGRPGVRRRASICVSSLPSAAGNEQGSEERASSDGSDSSDLEPVLPQEEVAQPAGKPPVLRYGSFNAVLSHGPPASSAAKSWLAPPISPRRHAAVVAAAAKVPPAAAPAAGSQAGAKGAGAGRSPVGAVSQAAGSAADRVPRASLDVLRAADARGKPH